MVCVASDIFSETPEEIGPDMSRAAPRDARVQLNLDDVGAPKARPLTYDALLEGGTCAADIVRHGIKPLSFGRPRRQLEPALDPPDEAVPHPVEEHPVDAPRSVIHTGLGGLRGTHAQLLEEPASPLAQGLAYRQGKVLAAVVSAPLARPARVGFREVAEPECTFT